MTGSKNVDPGTVPTQVRAGFRTVEWLRGLSASDRWFSAPVRSFGIGLPGALSCRSIRVPVA
ncbi:hypothetical protein [Rhodovulum viride]|uniref:hypothetical protein n=1 Tax=Rhodovulum viride TaxID=1231134 RepID=UPI0011BEC8E2|nr:hypothetical protein [Rhodovulum viride]